MTEYVEFDYAKRENGETLAAPDVWLQAQATTVPDLAFCNSFRARNLADSIPSDVANYDPPDALQGHRWGSPFSFLKLERIRPNPISSQPDRDPPFDCEIKPELEALLECSGCKDCIGIDLEHQVVASLIEAAKDRILQTGTLWNGTA
ncbi:MAG: hypothetical protein AAGB04_21240 [Pseudomonadota bacterium]